MRSPDMARTVHASDFKAQTLPNLYFIAFKDGLSARQFEIRVSLSSEVKPQVVRSMVRAIIFFRQYPVCLKGRGMLQDASVSILARPGNMSGQIREKGWRQVVQMCFQNGAASKLGSSDHLWMEVEAMTRTARMGSRCGLEYKPRARKPDQAVGARRGGQVRTRRIAAPSRGGCRKLFAGKPDRATRAYAAVGPGPVGVLGGGGGSSIWMRLFLMA